MLLAVKNAKGEYSVLSPDSETKPGTKVE